ncbi:MAG TPA: von Willebrand factor type A domain-containing protein [Bdellovibrionales bacterium]|nr:von Willebrand factor type A domain-containing protein [Bdellovibrionales bacterium]
MSTQSLRDSYLLTAYALGELEGAEAAEMRQLVEQDPELQALVLEIRQATGLLREELADRKPSHLTPLEKSKIEMGWLKEHKRAVGRRSFGRLAMIAASAAAIVLAVWATVSRLKRQEQVATVAQKPAPQAPVPPSPMARVATESKPAAERPAVGVPSDRAQVPLSLAAAGTATAQRLSVPPDVGIGSYPAVRAALDLKRRPAANEVRIEELVNYFSYDDPEPRAGESFAITGELARAPWDPSRKLLRVAVKARAPDFSASPQTNLVIVVDVSGSMNSPEKLPLARQALKLLVDHLRERDTVAIVAYAGSSSLVLPRTQAARKSDIMRSLEKLAAGGFTDAVQGFELAFKISREGHVAQGNNRILLLSDGDFGGTAIAQTTESLARRLEQHAKAGIRASILGFGLENKSDSELRRLARLSNTSFDYVDSLSAARLAFLKQMGPEPAPLALDPKLSVTFNPKVVASYRLLGYEPAGPAGQAASPARAVPALVAGQSLVALFELVPAPQATPGQGPGAGAPIATVEVAYTTPSAPSAKSLAFQVSDSNQEFAAASKEYRFTAAVAMFGMLLTEPGKSGAATYDMVREILRETQVRGGRIDTYRRELADLVEVAQRLPPSG